jgi:hypothetical protein
MLNWLLIVLTLYLTEITVHWLIAMGLTTQNTDIKVKIQIQYCQTNNMVPIFILGKNTQANHAILSPNTNSIVIIYLIHQSLITTIFIHQSLITITTIFYPPIIDYHYFLSTNH